MLGPGQKEAWLPSFLLARGCPGMSHPDVAKADGTAGDVLALEAGFSGPGLRLGLPKWQFL